MVDLVRRRFQKGFTLIELLLVVAIIGILASIAIPAYLNRRIATHNSVAAADLRNLKVAIESAYSETMTYPDASTIVGN